MRVGVLTSGGDAPGLNAVIRGAVLQGVRIHGHEMVGFRDGWRGVLDADTVPLTAASVRGIARQGGTILGSSRTHPLERGDGRAGQVLAELGVDALIAIGGEGTLGGAHHLALSGLPIVGVPKTVDNDLAATDYTFGFDTAVSIATDAMDRLRTTGDSHSRCMVAEVMGRHAGWIALHAGVAAGAHAILIPEQEVTLDQLTDWVRSAHARGRAPLVAVAEGFELAGLDAVRDRGRDSAGRPRLGSISERVAEAIEARTGIETRASLLGHIQRGGTPTAFDRVLGTRFGIAAADAVERGEWDTMVALRGTDVCRVPLGEALDSLKRVPPRRYAEAALLFG